MREDMRGLFYIVRGQYRRNKGIKFFNDISQDYQHIGGYDPEDTTNEEWYMLVDSETFSTLACGSDLNRVVKCAGLYIRKYKTRDKYLKMIKSLEYPPLPSPVMRRLQEEVYKHYGDYYEDLIDEEVGNTYEEVRDEMVNPLFKKAKKRLVKKTPQSEVITPSVTLVQEVVKEETPLTHMVRPKKKLGIKKLSME
jgi:hypothetical protein